MTLIAQLSVNNAPLLIGDVLLSSEVNTGLKVSLPLVGNVNEVLAKHGQPFEVNFAQKLHVFSDNLAVAWSGSAIEATRALGALSRLAQRRDALCIDEIGSELNVIRDVIPRLQLIGVLLGKRRGAERAAHCFALGVQPIEVPYFGRVFATGSGRDFFLNMLPKSDWTHSGTGSDFQVAHVLLGALTNEDYRTGQSILGRWGGGYEAVTCSQQTGRFEKVGNILHTFWTLHAANGSIDFSPMFYKTAYWQDALLIRAVRFDDLRTFKLAYNDLTLKGESERAEAAPCFRP
jgi:hypothetical protein